MVDLCGSFILGIFWVVAFVVDEGVVVGWCIRLSARCHSVGGLSRNDIRFAFATPPFIVSFDALG